MVKHSSPDRLDAVFHALADPTRRAMLQSLAENPRPVGELAAPFAISLAAASKHIKVLEGAGLLQRTVSGRTHLCALDAAPLHAGMEWIRHYERFWQERLDVLEALLKAEDRARQPRTRHPSRRKP
ncbi:metalloregulator ArsR/SmtB family transcription factor [Hydrogenophaga sp.]|uniref:ArsR/SmtB family transcription factor n=1 Tax=Hydrogenophaga sp. TaxID=1904254 RepID=UPI00262A5F3B|nr:metalloregulator ArsR/SmtB family transcription factor [Hydrogenophaga sp.]MCW5655337.1 helix-turn-helix transcriptional regulator [Hydrogenophaga sp.]